MKTVYNILIIMDDENCVNEIENRLTSETNNEIVELPSCRNTFCHKKIKALEYCVEDLTEQNQTFLETVLELENEAKNRVSGIEELLSRTAETAKAYMVNLNEYEEMTAKALRDKKNLIKHIRNLQEKCHLLDEEKATLQDQNNNLSHDIASFIKLVSHARNTGQWDVGNIEFCDVTFEQVFGSTEMLNHWSDEEMCPTPKSLPDNQNDGQLNKSSLDCLSASAQLFLSHVGLNYRNGYHVKRDTQVIKLQGELNRTRKILTALENDLTERDRTIAELQVQITDLNHEISRREAECFVHTQQFISHRISSIESIDLLDSTKSNDLDQHAQPSMCNHCHDRLNLIEQLQKDNQKLYEECENNQKNLDKCCSDIEAALLTNSKLEQELSVTESLWQELEAIKEENETLLDKLKKKCKAEKELEKKLHVTKREMSGEVEQLKSELSKLKEMETRHRQKAVGLEMVVQQLQLGQPNGVDNFAAEIEQLNKLKVEQQSQVEELQKKLQVLESSSNSDLKVVKLEENMTDLRHELEVTLSLLKTKNDEIELQKSTIHNLQDAIVALKRNKNGLDVVVTSNDKHNSSAARSVQKPQKSLQRYTSSGDIFDI
ncbi:hypothetical protein CHUAL_001807 [Chamberlinius hualienensis]